MWQEQDEIYTLKQHVQVQLALPYICEKLATFAQGKLSL